MGNAQDELVHNIWVLEESLPSFRSFMETFDDKASEIEMQLLFRSRHYSQHL